MRLFPAALIETTISVQFVRERPTRMQDGACRLESEKKSCSDVGRNADTRDGHACLRLCTDAKEPLYTNVF